MSTLETRLRQAAGKAAARLLSERNKAGHWEGELAESALSTATAVTALSIWRNHVSADAAKGFKAGAVDRAITSGIAWLVDNQNADGGWGDTTRSFSNISTTALGWAAFGAVDGADEHHAGSVARARAWLRRKAGGVSPRRLAEAITARYGKDKTFSVPILTMCTLAGRLGGDAWRYVTQLPFELAAFPQEMFAALRLPVVSYALPALIAMGQARHKLAPSGNPVMRVIRNLALGRTLRVLRNIQPASGGYLEATPLTSFVTMTLAAAGNADHAVSLSAVEFLLASMREDGSWPIDTNLATWVTTLSVNAMSLAGPMEERSAAPLREWLLAQHYREVHPFTNAPPGGWAWTDLSGGVPDADDTPGALLALDQLDNGDPRVSAAARAGVRWLLNLQNSDGGIPTFCRGWTNLPFDRSSPDLTAHTLRAWVVWRDRMPPGVRADLDRATEDALNYLAATQRACGSWLPLWFGNQHSNDDENPTYGTAQVLKALNLMPDAYRVRTEEMIARAAAWLIRAQKADGSWSGGGDWPSSIEESALALDALAGCSLPVAGIGKALASGAEWIAVRVEDDSWIEPSPIGFYFAKLWYFERLYPQIFTVGALNRLVRRGLS
jgi:squalene-hopene/tetraprenyl-beta-curcumene cyclase